MSQGLILFENQIKDTYIQENFRRVKVFLRDEPILKAGFKFYEIDIPKAISDMVFPHHLDFQPKDVITTSVTNGQTVTWIYDSFSLTNVVLTVSGPCKIRVLLGTYTETL